MDKLHFSRAPKLRELEKSIARGTKEIFMPQSAFARLGAKAKKTIQEKGVHISIENARGRPLSIDLSKVAEIVELHRDHRTYREIENLTGIPKSSAHYLVKYAERQKIKKGNKVVYL